MKIIQINSDYYYGSTGKLTKNLHEELLANNINSMVFYGRNIGKNEPNVKSFISPLFSKIEHFFAIIIGNPYGLCWFSTKKIINEIKKEKPDLIHIQCINGYFVNIYKLLKNISKMNIPIVITLHAEFMYTGGCDHSFNCNGWIYGCKNCPQKTKKFGIFSNRSSHIFNCFKKTYKKLDAKKVVIVSVSDWLKFRAMKSPLLSKFKHYTVLNGVDTSVFNYKKFNLCNYNSNLKTRTLLYVTACFSPDDYQHNKGSKFIIDLAKLLIKNKRKVKIIVCANYSKITKDLPYNIVFKGKITNQEDLAKYYNISDLTIITSKRETFGMPVAESLCCGTPVVGFLSGGPECIALPEYASFVKYGDIDAMYNEIFRLLNKDFDKQEISKEAIKKYSIETMCKEYIDLYKKMVIK